jgi:hypothetical protein
MEQKSLVEDIKKIRSLMENSVVYNSLSGLSGVAAGIIGIVVYFIVYGMINPAVQQDPNMRDSPVIEFNMLRLFFTASAVCLTLAFSAIFFFNARKARKAGEAFYTPAMRKMFINLFIPLIAGGIYCLMLVREGEYGLVAPTMLVFYGLAMIMASRNTIIEIRYLGFAELILGLIALFVKTYGMWFWLAGFGFVNVAYGLYIYFQYEKNSGKGSSI